MPQNNAQLKASGRVVIPLPIAGMYSAGDPASIPDGYTRSITNMLLRPNRVDSRPPAVYDNLTGVIGLGTWEDLTNRQRRFIALDATKLYKKSTSSETWDPGTTASTVTYGTRFLSSTNFGGRFYMAFDDGSGTLGKVFRYDGTNFKAAEWVAQDGAASSTVNATALAAFDNRLYLAGTAENLVNSAAASSSAYDFTAWTLTNVTAKNLTLTSGQTVCRLYPTSTAVNGSSADSGAFVAYTGSSLPTPTIIRWDLRGTNAQLTSVQDTNLRHRAATVAAVGAPGGAVPVTIEIYLQSQRANITAYSVGDIMAFGGFRFRCSVAGTSAAAPPAFNTATNTTTVDGGTLTWVSEGSDAIATQEFTVPSISEITTWSPVVLSCDIPAFNNTIRTFGLRLKFWNSLYSSIPTLTAIDASLKDGKTDGDPTKQNYGLQWVIGGFNYPFFNQESSSTVVGQSLYALMWTEINNPTIRAANYYNPQDIAGTGTAVIAASNRLILFKRFGYWIMAPTSDPDIPILPETTRAGIGCIGPQALSILDDEVFFVADREIYRMKVGYEPKPICGDAMREEIMDHSSSTWVESQSTYKMPILTIDEKNREVYVYVQKGKLYVYHLGDAETPGVVRPYTPEKGQWTVVDLQGKEVQAMAYNRATGEMEISLGGFGLVRLDPTSPLKDVIDNTASQYSVDHTIIFKPIEQFAPRYDALVEEIALYHTATASQSGQTLTAYISTDRGQTYPYQITAVFDQTVARIPIPVWQMAPSITLKVVYSGKTGQTVFGLSRAEATLNVKRGEYPQTTPTLSGATL